MTTTIKREAVFVILHFFSIVARKLNRDPDFFVPLLAQLNCSCHSSLRHFDTLHGDGNAGDSIQSNKHFRVLQTDHANLGKAKGKAFPLYV